LGDVALHAEEVAVGLVRGVRRLRLARVSRPDQEVVRRRQCDLWAFVWASSSVLADVTTELLATDGGAADVVELGAGCGLASLAAAAAGATVLATDLVPDALRLLEHNAAANGAVLATARLDWSSAADQAAVAVRLQDGKTGAADQLQRRRLVVGADILFASWTVRPVLATMAALLGTDGVGVLVDPGRTNRDTVEDGAAAAAGLKVVRRVDWDHLRTPIALMRVCTIFLLAPAGSTAPPWCLDAFDAACAWLGTHRCIPADAVAATGAVHGYTLAPVR
jgi:predicted nicotinamide N-methyase